MRLPVPRLPRDKSAENFENVKVNASFFQAQDGRMCKAEALPSRIIFWRKFMVPDTDKHELSLK